MKRLIKIELICLAINPAENFEYNVIVDEKNRFPTLDLGKGTIRESLDKLMREYVNTTTDWVKPSALNVSDGFHFLQWFLMTLFHPKEVGPI